MAKRMPLIIGFAGASALLLFYLIILSAINSPTHALSEFARLWYWILALVAGFGIQVGLYSFVRREIGKRDARTTAEVAAAGGVSTGSMIACCAHHVATDLLPAVGISASAAALFSEYQVPLIATGIASNAVGSSMMLHIIQKRDLYPDKGLLASLRKIDAVKVRNMATALAVFFVLLSFALVKGNDVQTASNSGDGSGNSGIPSKPSSRNGNGGPSGDSRRGAGETKTSGESSVEIAVTPIDLGRNARASFEISMNTHSVELDYDLLQISTLEDDLGTAYSPVKWEGSPSGGHHRSGVLIFPKLSSRAKSVRLIIKDVAGVPARSFEWEVPN